MVRIQKLVNRPRPITLLVGLPIIACFGIGFYFTVFRAVDQSICVSRISSQLNIAPTYGALYSFIDNALVPGMTRSQVATTLSQIGPVNTREGQQVINGVIADAVYVNPCWHPLNNVVLFTRYGTDGKLVSIRIETD